MLIGRLGAILSMVVGICFGRILPTSVDLGIMVWRAVVFMGRISTTILFASAFPFNATFAFHITYYLGYCAAVDQAGRVVPMAHFVIAAELTVVCR